MNSFFGEKVFNFLRGGPWRPLKTMVPINYWNSDMSLISRQLYGGNDRLIAIVEGFREGKKEGEPSSSVRESLQKTQRQNPRQYSLDLFSPKDPETKPPTIIIGSLYSKDPETKPPTIFVGSLFSKRPSTNRQRIIIGSLFSKETSKL